MNSSAIANTKHVNKHSYNYCVILLEKMILLFLKVEEQ